MRIDVIGNKQKIRVHPRISAAEINFTQEENHD
jgi:hypothetical protein